MHHNHRYVGLAAMMLALIAGCGDSIISGPILGGPIHLLLARAGGPYEGLSGQPIQFDGSSSSDSDGHPLTYDWSFGDGGTSSVAMPSHTYSETGTYDVTLEVCDGSRCNSDSTSAFITASTGTGFARGVISEFGSVVVGGTHYVVTANTTITVDDDSGNTENDLKLGDYVEIRSTFNYDGITRTFTADTIDAAESVEGPVNLPASSIDGSDAGTLQVLGQKVRVTPATILDNTDFGAGGLTELVNDDYVEVHGLRRLDGSLDASRLERKAPAVNVVETTGVIGTADPLSDSFTINGLTVTYTLAGLLGFPGTREPAVDDLVEVKGTSAGLTVGPTLAADSVELITRGLSAEDDDIAEIEGFIEGCDPNLPICDNFRIDGVSVQLAGSVTYEGRGYEDHLGNDIKIEAEGNFLGGTLITNKIEFKIDNKARVEAYVESNSGTALVLLGTTFQYDANTAFEDNSESPVADITLVEDGHYVVARGDGSYSEIQATDVKRDDPPSDGRMIVRGLVDWLSTDPAPALGVLGVTVELTDNTQCRNLDDEPYVGGCSAFFSDIKGGLSIVKARGVSFSGGVLTADEIETEN